MTVSFETANDLPSVLWDSPDWRKSVFGIKSVQRYNVHSFFLQLVAKRIISFQWENSQSQVSIVLNRDDNDNFVYDNIASWEGFTFRSAERGGAPLEYIDILRGS